MQGIRDTLIAEHDRLYGPGTGKTFVEGPYASDLPRALKARLRPALKRQAAQLATFEDGPQPAAAATDTTPQVPPSLPPVQSNPSKRTSLRFGHRYRRGLLRTWPLKGRLEPRSPLNRSSLRPGT